MSRILAITAGAVEKSGVRRSVRNRNNWGRVRNLSWTIVAMIGLAEASEGVGAWRLTSEERERELIAMKKQWAREPGSAGMAIDLASLLLLQGRREEAVRILLSAHAAASSEKDRARLEKKVKVISRSFITVDGARDFQAGANALQAGNYKAALTRFESVIGVEQQVLDALVRKGQAEVLLGRQDSAAETLRAARQMNPFEPELKMWLGHVLLGRGEKEEGAQEVLAAWRLSTPEQRNRPHWKAWMVEALVALGRSGAAKKMLPATLGDESNQWTPSSGWRLWSVLLVDPSAQARVKKFLNLFPNGYQRLLGASGLDLDWWDPRLLDIESDTRVLGLKKAGEKP